MKPKKIKSIEELKSMCLQGQTDFFIRLNGGLISKKEIIFAANRFCVLNLIDGTRQTLTETQINDDALTNIGKAIQLGAFYVEEYE